MSTRTNSNPDRGNNSNSRRGKPSQKTRTRNNQRRTYRQDDDPYHPINRSVTVVTSPLLSAELRCPMVYEDTSSLSGAATVSIRYNPNALFALKTGVSSSFPIGWAPRILEYGFYRVMSYRYVIFFQNTEAFPVNLIVTNSDNDYGTSPTVAFAANPLCQQKTIGALTGNGSATISRFVTVVEIVGDQTPLYDSTYRSLITDTPADTMWLGVGAQSMTGATLTVGVRYSIRLTCNTIWTNRLQQT